MRYSHKSLASMARSAVFAAAALVVGCGIKSGDPGDISLRGGLASTAAGDGGSTRPYNYPGCEDAGLVADTCHGGATVLCAIGEIADTYANCSSDSDCVVQPFGSACFSTCGFAVAASSADSFTQDADAQGSDYCAKRTDGCNWFAQCDPDVAVCVSGKCRLAHGTPTVPSDGGS